MQLLARIPAALLVFLGGGAGALLRYGMTLLIPPRYGLPLATLLVNCAGSLAVGLLFGLREKRHVGAGSEVWLLLAVGLCGGFTTLSAFSLETLHLLQQRQLATAFAYLALTLAGALLCVWVGIRLGEKIF